MSKFLYFGLVFNEETLLRHLLADLLLIHCVFKKLSETNHKSLLQFTVESMTLTECLHGTSGNHFHTRQDDKRSAIVQIPDPFLFFFPFFFPVQEFLVLSLFLFLKKKKKTATANQHIKGTIRGKNLGNGFAFIIAILVKK